MPTISNLVTIHISERLIILLRYGICAQASSTVVAISIINGATHRGLLYK